MADPFLAEIRIFPYNYAPQYWAFCSGSLMPINQNSALFALLGTTYGGNGISNFSLPDLRERMPLQQGQGPNLTPRSLGEMGGSDSVTLTIAELPAHTHELLHSGSVANTAAPGLSVGFGSTGVAQVYASASGTPVTMLPQTLLPAGSGLPHNNRQPYLALSFCISLQGIFPQRP